MDDVPYDLSKMTLAEIEAELAAGRADAEAGRVIPIEDVLAQLRAERRAVEDLELIHHKS